MKVNDATLNLLLDISGGMAAKDDILLLDEKSENDIPVSRKAKKKVYRYIGRIHEISDNSPVYYTLKRTAVFVLILFSVVFFVMFSIQPVRAAFVNTIKKWYSDHIGITVLSGGYSDEIDKPLVPGFIPDEWDYMISADRYSSMLVLSGIGDDRITVTKTVNNNSESLWIDDGYLSEETVTLIEGIEGQLYTYKDKYILVYENDFVYCAIGNCDKDL